MRFIIPLLLILINACTATKPNYLFEERTPPPAPDYSKLDYWAAHPEKEDPADLTPSNDYLNIQDTAAADVFFLHPTTYVGGKGENDWNANINNQELNDKTDQSTILYQASIFNGVGRIYAPRYRQAHYDAYFNEDKKSALKAFGLAYKDVAAAFDYYLKHYHQGRPIIIAAHSQGTTHAIRLIKEYFSKPPLSQDLVVAYLAGMPVVKDTFPNIPQCQNEFDTGCFCSWRTFKKGHTPKKAITGDHIAVNNPLSWSTDETPASEMLNIGGLARKFEGGILPGMNDAQVHQGVLWASKPKFPGSIFLIRKNYHIADYNLFYTNIRQNARERLIAYLQSHSETAIK